MTEKHVAEIERLDEAIRLANRELDRLAVPAGGELPERIRHLWDYIHMAEKIIEASEELCRDFEKGGDVLNRKLLLRDLLDDMKRGRKTWDWSKDDENDG